MAARQTRTSTGGRSYTIAGFVFAVVGLAIFGIVLEPLAIVFGYLGHKKGDRFGKWVMVAGAVLLVLTVFVISAAVSESS